MLTIPAHAKVNLLLDVLFKREDGFHELRSIMQSLELHDLIGLESAKGISLHVNNGAVAVPEGPENLAWQAAERLRTYTAIKEGVKITLSKYIPTAAGLGGGSSDAAAVLKGLNKLWGLNMDMDELATVGAGIGSDVPFCLYGGTALARGRGEKVTPLPSLPVVNVVLIKPSQGLSTAEVYRHYSLGGCPKTPSLNAEGMVDALKLQDTNRVIELLGNSLEPTAISLLPEIGNIKRVLMENGALGVLVSGSGPTVLGIAKSKKHARILADNFVQGEMTAIVTKTHREKG